MTDTELLRFVALSVVAIVVLIGVGHALYRSSMQLTKLKNNPLPTLEQMRAAPTNKLAEYHREQLHTMLETERINATSDAWLFAFLIAGICVLTTELSWVSDMENTIRVIILTVATVATVATRTIARRRSDAAMRCILSQISCLEALQLQKCMETICGLDEEDVEQ